MCGQKSMFVLKRPVFLWHWVLLLSEPLWWLCRRIYIHPVCFPLLPFPASKPLTFRVSHFTVLTSNRKKGWQTSPSDMWSVSLNIYNYCVTIIPINTQLITITQLLLINYYHSPESIPLLLPSYLPSFFPPFFPPSLPLINFSWEFTTLGALC